MAQNANTGRVFGDNLTIPSFKKVKLPYFFSMRPNTRCFGGTFDQDNHNFWLHSSFGNIWPPQMLTSSFAPFGRSGRVIHVTMCSLVRNRNKNIPRNPQKSEEKSKKYHQEIQKISLGNPKISPRNPKKYTKIYTKNTKIQNISPRNSAPTKYFFLQRIIEKKLLEFCYLLIQNFCWFDFYIFLKKICIFSKSFSEFVLVVLTQANL